MTLPPVPGPVSNLTLLTDKNSLTAKWSPMVTERSSFNVELQLSGKQVKVVQKLESRAQFNGLKRGVNYTVIVSMVIGVVTGLSVEASIYTRESPAPPPSPQQPSQQHTQQ